MCIFSIYILIMFWKEKRKGVITEHINYIKTRMVNKMDVIYFFFNIWEIFMFIFKLLKQEYMLK